MTPAAPKPRKTPAKRRKPVTRSNPTRRAKEFARAYGSGARVMWVKGEPCVIGLLCLGAVENAHTRGGGAGRKAAYTTIVPLCNRHHRLLHAFGRGHLERTWLIDLDAAARATEARWQAYCRSQ